MRYENNSILQGYLDCGAAGTLREHPQHPAFDLGGRAFAASAAEPPEVAVALASRWYRVGAWTRRVAPAVWLWVRISLAIAVLAALCAIAGHAEPDPDANAVSVADRLHALEIRPPQLFQLSNGAARVQFQSSGVWSFVSSGTPFPITCVSGCSATGAFSDNSAFTVGSTAIVPIGALYDSGTAPAISNGNAGRVRMDANSYLYVDCTIGCSGSSFSDGASFAAGSTPISITGGWYSSSPTNCTSGDACAPQLTVDRKLFVQAFQGTSPWVSSVTTWGGGTLGAMANYGTSPGAVLVPGVNAFITNTPAVSESGNWTSRVVGNAGGVMDAAGQNATAPANELLSGCEYNSAPTTVTSGNITPTQCDSKGQTKTAIYDAAGNNRGADVDANNELNVSNPTAANLNVRADTSGATAAAPPARADFIGGLGSGATGGEVIGVPVADTYKAINISTATTTLIVTGVSGRQVRISAQHMIAAGADNVAWIEGTGATCGTGTAGMAGGTTAASGYNFAANGGITEGAGIGTVLATVTTGDSVCLVTSAAVQLSGGISYTIY
jgi:hypothetical protein